MKKIFILLLMSISLTLFIFTTQNSKDAPIKFDERIEQFYQSSKAECQDNTNTCKKYEIAKLAIAGDLTQAQAIEKNLLESKLIDINQCHVISHFLGEISYYKYGLNQTINNKESGCLQGFYHGAIFQYVKNIKSNIGISQLRVICNLTNSANQDQQICIHGIGHAFLYSKDLEYAVNKCAEVFDQKLRGVRKIESYSSCLGGVFASELTKNPGHQSMKIKLTSLSIFLNECEKLEEKTKKVCISFYGMEGLARSEIPPSSYLLNCLSIEKYEIDCAQGVGISFANYHSVKLEEISNFCTYPKNEKLKIYSQNLSEKAISACEKGYQSALFLNPHLEKENPI